MKVIYLFDGAIYGPTRFIVGCDNMASEIVKWFESTHYVCECQEIDIHRAQEIADGRTEEEDVRVFKWMDKYFDHQNGSGKG